MDGRSPRFPQREADLLTAESLRIHLADVSCPLDVASLFGRPGPLVVEIGFGNGIFFRDLAREHPDWNIIGAEIAAASLTRGLGMIRREELDHVRLYCGDGHFVLRGLVAPRSLHRLYVNFPDPWPKEKHQEKRLLQAPFFRLLASRLEPGTGEFWFTSDHEEYFEFSVREAESTGLFEIERGVPPEQALRTKYAQRWQQEHKTIHHAVFRPRTADVDGVPGPPLEVDMPHARLVGDLASIDRFEKQTFRENDGTIVLLECARELGGERLLIPAIVDEPDLRQDLLIEVRRAGSGKIYVELLAFGRPANTPLVQRAVECVAEWLRAQGMKDVTDAG